MEDDVDGGGGGGGTGYCRGGTRAAACFRHFVLDEFEEEDFPRVRSTVGRRVSAPVESVSMDDDGSASFSSALASFSIFSSL